MRPQPVRAPRGEVVALSHLRGGGGGCPGGCRRPHTGVGRGRDDKGPSRRGMRLSLAPGVAGNVSSPPPLGWGCGGETDRQHAPPDGGGGGARRLWMGACPRQPAPALAPATPERAGMAGAASREGPLMAYRPRPELVVVVMAVAPAPAAFPLGRA